jgi:hypothetical protein
MREIAGGLFTPLRALKIILDRLLLPPHLRFGLDETDAPTSYMKYELHLLLHNYLL